MKSNDTNYFAGLLAKLPAVLDQARRQQHLCWTTNSLRESIKQLYTLTWLPDDPEYPTLQDLFQPLDQASATIDESYRRGVAQTLYPELVDSFHNDADSLDNGVETDWEGLHCYAEELTAELAIPAGIETILNQCDPFSPIADDMLADFGAKAMQELIIAVAGRAKAVDEFCDLVEQARKGLLEALDQCNRTLALAVPYC